MQPVTAIAVYFVTWWIVIFVVLPWGVRRTDKPEAGHADGAPAQAMMLRKILWTTTITSILWIGFYIVNRYNLLSIRDLVQ